MAVRLDKPWQLLDELTPRDLPGQLGVFELANDRGEVLYIGAADPRDAFGLRSAISDARRKVAGARRCRWEINTAYRTRHRELLMVHVADHGRLPPANPPIELGRLSPA